MDSISSYALLITFLLGGVISIGLFLVVLILKSRPLGISRYFLGFAMLFLIFQLGSYLLFTTQLIKLYPHLLGVTYPTLFLVGPCFYLFVRSFNNDSFQFKVLYILHLIPFIYIAINQLEFYISSDTHKQEVVAYYYEHIPTGQLSFASWLQSNSHILLLMAYVIWSYISLQKRPGIQYTWIKRVSWILLMLGTLYLITQSGTLITGASAITSEIVLSGLLALTILMVGYWTLDIKNLLPAAPASYKTSALSPEKLEKLNLSLTIWVKENKSYLDANLKIGKLAEDISVPKHHISQVLSENMNTNFYDFINKYRIEEAKKRLLDGTAERLSIQAIGEECGFNNKNTFYRSFKKFTGTTPNQFIKQYTAHLTQKT